MDEDISLMQPAIAVAYRITIDNNENTKGYVDDMVPKLQFQNMLVNIRRYLEINAAFNVRDYKVDRKINFTEFEASLGHLQSRGVEIADAASDFRQIDVEG